MGEQHGYTIEKNAAEWKKYLIYSYDVYICV